MTVTMTIRVTIVKSLKNNVCDKTAMVTITTKTIMKMTIKTMTDNK